MRKPRLSEKLKQVLASVRVPPLSVTVKTKNTEGCSHYDSVMRIPFRDNFDMGEKLRALINVHIDDDLNDGGEIIIGRRRSHG